MSRVAVGACVCEQERKSGSCPARLFPVIILIHIFTMSLILLMNIGRLLESVGEVHSRTVGKIVFLL